MSLNIKNPEAHRLAQELAELTGESMATAVTEAVRERLEKLRREHHRQERLSRLTAIAASCAARLNAPGRAMMETDDLYDEETGLPK
jgi:antitoxin VapB